MTFIRPFDRAEHVYTDSEFGELIRNAIRFFNGTPVHSLPPPSQFLGTGVYALYYTGTTGIYGKYGQINRTSYDMPIYVGKAVPKGWRQARLTDSEMTRSRELSNRLREHARSIQCTETLDLNDFACRFMILEGEVSDMIGTVEAGLIKLNRPLWNSSVDGFGNHDPGSGRYMQAKSDWDVIHPGRAWAEKCAGSPKTSATIVSRIEQHLSKLGT